MASPINIPSRIKSIYIELDGYNFNHSPSSDNKYFVGRKEAEARLKNLLLHSGDCPGGAYLVTGYRGMGKTTLVERVIASVNKEAKDSDTPDIYDKINISLSQDDIKDIDVLKFIASQLCNAWMKWLSKIQANANYKFMEFKLRTQLDDIGTKLEGLSNSLNSIVKFSTKFKKTVDLQSVNKREIIRPESLPKEVEKELILILESIDSIRKRIRLKSLELTIPYFIFVVDELDKIEPSYFYDMDYSLKDVPTQEKLDNIFGINKVRRRQEVIARLLANLKSFLNTAKAKFIFIGGREMYDAALADIADRDSFYSSIFHDIIYVNSFFKDKISASRSGLTRATEAFLCKVIIPEKYAKKYMEAKHTELKSDEIYNLTTCFHYLIDLSVGNFYFHNAFQQLKNSKEHKKEEQIKKEQSLYKALFFLQNLVLYLTFRSNGTPKKLVSLLESFIIELSEEQITKAEDKEDIVIKTNSTSNRRLFLKFGYTQQYEIGLTSNIYRPYVIIHSRYLKSLGDKLLYSTAYIIDYLFKYHPHAFSWRNLELIPEIILINKDPNLRYFLSDILKFLTGMYIRETTNSMFEYTFYSKQANEIKLLSKISETASAAFNFTLDESLQIIRYYRRRLDELIKAHPNFNEEYIHSVGFVQSILGDLYYFDKEYDEAIIYYTDSVQFLRKLAQQDPKRLTKHQCVLYVRNKLLLGLCLEKIRAHDSAYSIYRGLILNVPLLLDAVMLNPSNNELLTTSFNDEWDKPIRRMQLFIKPHIALLDLIEKQRMNGITYANLSRNFREVYEFLVDDKAMSPNAEITIGKGVSLAASTKKRDGVRVSTLMADYYSNVGSLLFFKNRNFPELYTQLMALFFTEPDKHLFEFIKKHKSGHSYLPSISALAYYLIGINELVKPYEKPLEMIRDTYPKDEQPDLLISKFFSQNNAISKALFLLLPECGGIISNQALINLGNLFSRIGDAILSSVSDKSTQNNPLTRDVWDIYTCSSNERKNLLSNIYIFLENAEVFEKLDNMCTIGNALVMYRIAGMFYLTAGKMYSYAFQYKKFLFSVKDYLLGLKELPEKGIGNIANINEANNTFRVLCEDIESVAVKIFRANTAISDVSNRPQILKYREIFRDATFGADREETRKIYMNLSTSGDIRETIVLAEEIKLKLSALLKIHPESPPKSHLSPYDVISNRFSRVNELRYHSDVNYYELKLKGIDTVLMSSLLYDLSSVLAPQKNTPNEIYSMIISKIKDTIDKGNATISLNDIFNDDQNFYSKKIKSIEAEISKRLPKIDTNKDIEQELERVLPELFDLHNWIQKKEINDDWLEKLICDSVFSLFEVIRTLNLYGANYISNFSFLANVHYKLANWCQISLNYDILMEQVSNDGNRSKIRDLLKQTLSEEDIHYLEPNYHNELAIQHYNSAIQTHSGGKTFKQFNQFMSFLEDDFNDNLTLFSAAAERFRINTGLVDKKIRDLREKINFSNVYDYKNYVEPNWSEDL